MAFMINKSLNVFKFRSYRNFSVLGPNYGYWHKDWVAGEYPRTVEERKAAAEKYNLHPNEYTPYPDNGFGYGDYPKLPFIGVALRDPFYPYDMPEHKRNFNEAIHIDIDMINEERYDAGIQHRYSTATTIAMFVFVYGSFFGLAILAENIPVFQPIMEKQYPWKGKTYYTFEKSN